MAAPQHKRTLEMIETLDGQWRWRLHGGNGEIICWSESYTEKAKAKRSVVTAGVGTKIDVTNGIFEYWSKEGELREGWYKEIKVEEELAYAAVVPDNNEGQNQPVTLDQLKTATQVVNMIGAGLTVLGDGHFVLNSHVYHPKHPTADQCAIPFCQMKMIVDGEVVQLDGHDYVR